MTPRPLTAEARLVFRTADPALDATEVATLARAVRDWRRTVLIADREFATAALWHALERAPGVPVPADIADFLRAQALVSGFRMQRLADRLQGTVRALRDAAVPVLLLKGAALGAMTDPTFRSRPMSDIDLLVRREDLPRAREAIVAAGWPRTSDPVLLELLKDAHHEPPFVDPQVPGLRLELHSRILPEDHSFLFDEGDLWRDAVPASAPFAGASLPSMEHFLLHACVHFAWSHVMSFGGWRTFRAINAVVQQRAIDWDRFIHAALAARAGTAAHWTLRLSVTLSGTRIPDGTLHRLAPPNPAVIQRALERHFVVGLAPGEGPPCPSVRLGHRLWRVALRPRWSGHRDDGGRWDPDNSWARAFGRASTESRTARFIRHLRGMDRWWSFATRTLGALGSPSRT